MIIAFSNRKGRVGKSSLCMALANYWASNSIPVKVIDVDPQQSLYHTRERDLKMYEEKAKYEVLRFDLSNQLDQFLECIQLLRKSEYRVILDTPAGVNCDIFMHVIKLADYVIIPFQYETFSIDMTGRYSRSLRLLERMFPKLHRTLVYIPNMVAITKGRIFNFVSGGECGNDVEPFCGGIKMPCIPLHECMQKMNTLFLAPEELVCVSPCFENLTNIIQEHNALNGCEQIHIK